MFPTDTWKLGMSIQAHCMSLIQEMSAHGAEMCLVVNSAGETERFVIA